VSPGSVEADGTSRLGPIAALLWLGASAVDGSDEFDTLELGRHRHVEDWTAG
jgi:hypothetical protein